VLDKPCDPSDLSQVIERSCSLQDLLADEKLRQAVGGLDSLPTVPRIYTELSQALANPEVEFDSIATIVEQDVAMSAKILQIVNSGFFGLRQRVSLMRNAISMLGMSMIRSLVLSIEVFRPYRGVLTTHSFTLDREQRHALLTASVARKLLPSRNEADDAFTAAMLHDIGKLVLVTRMPQVYGPLFDKSATELVAAHALEAEGAHVSHEIVGAYLLGLWGIPWPIVEAVAYHHHPARVRHEGFEVLDAVHVANHLIHEVMAGGNAPGEGYGLDDEYLSRMGVASKLDSWREMATEIAGLSAEDQE
jgi:HD-like signal output (HDOD) protein